MTTYKHAQPYLDKVLAAARRAGVKPGELRHVTVYHDEGCPALKGGPCCCAPEVVVMPTEGEVQCMKPLCSR